MVHWQVIVMAASNRKDVLDPALIRPGRFDRIIHVGAPDFEGRIEVLKVRPQRPILNPPSLHGTAVGRTSGYSILVSS